MVGFVLFFNYLLISSISLEMIVFYFLMCYLY